MSYAAITEEASEPRPGVTRVRVAADDGGQRIDNWLMKRLKGVPRSRIYRILRKGEVRVNGRRAKPELRLADGDEVRLPPVRTAEAMGPARAPDRLLSEVEGSIVFEDEAVIALAKPAGLAVHGGSGLAFGVIEALRASRPGEPLELAHRLDRDTSGLLLIAKGRAALTALHGLFRDGRVEKRYLALVKGHWDLGKKRIDLPLATRARTHGQRVVRVHEAGKASASRFAPVDFFGRTATLLEVGIDTGRTHQIRVHAAHVGHPVAGDDKYGDREFNESLQEAGLTRMFLHAQLLSFEWPATGKQFSVSVPLPAELAAVLDRLTAGRRRRGARRR
jgi:23S rRNA pseudouridine955/2504/2580 synthase